MTTEVVPSPTSLSCISDSCTSTRAAGCSTSMLARIVAPSLVMVTSPKSSTSILSRPIGPRDVLTTLATESAAVTARRTSGAQGRRGGREYKPEARKLHGKRWQCACARNEPQCAWVRIVQSVEVAGMAQSETWMQPRSQRARLISSKAPLAQHMQWQKQILWGPIFGRLCVPFCVRTSWPETRSPLR